MKIIEDFLYKFKRKKRKKPKDPRYITGHIERKTFKKRKKSHFK